MSLVSLWLGEVIPSYITSVSSLLFLSVAQNSHSSHILSLDPSDARRTFSNHLKFTAYLLIYILSGSSDVYSKLSGSECRTSTRQVRKKQQTTNSGTKQVPVTDTYRDIPTESGEGLEWITNKS